MSELQNNSVTELAEAPGSIKSALGNFIVKRFESFLAGVSDGQLALTWPGGTTTYYGSRSEDASNNASLTLHSLQPIRQLAVHGDVGFAESYLRGEWSTDSLLNLFHLILRNDPGINTTFAGSFRNRFVRFLKHWQNRNSKAGSQRNIAFHYDLGNDFYSLWLDNSMTYSSGVYESEIDSLAKAQQNKMAKVCAMLQPDAGSKVLEIGCGWGALAKFMASSASVDVEGISLSTEQLAYAEKHNSIGNSGKGSTAFRHQDYREVDNKYDHIVSIEMFEAVGEKYWEIYFNRLNQLINNEGSAVLQVITIDESRFENYRKQPDFIQRYIFPGGMLPTRTHLAKLAENSGFDIEQTHWFGKSYARTLADWRQKFETVHTDINVQGFDERFIRMWRYYLVYCETAFNLGFTDVGLIKLVKRT